MAARWSRRTLLAWNIPLLLVFSAPFWLLPVYFYNFCFGPFQYDDAQLLKLAERARPARLAAYVDLKDRMLVPTGMVQVNPTRELIPYFVMPVKDKRLLVQAESQTQEARLVGPVDGMSDELRKEIVEKLLKENPEAEGRILPLVMYAGQDFVEFGWLIVSVFGPFVLVCLFNVIRGLFRRPAPPRAAEV